METLSIAQIEAIAIVLKDALKLIGLNIDLGELNERYQINFMLPIWYEFRDQIATIRANQPVNNN